MGKIDLVVLPLFLLTTPALAAVTSFASNFRTEYIPVNGTIIHVRVGGSGPAIVLLHGYAVTGDMWVPLAINLARDHTVIVPDLRGLGLSSRPDGGYDKKTQGGDITGLLDALSIGNVALVTHDIGSMVGYAFAADNRERVTSFVIMESQLPGLGAWEEKIDNPQLPNVYSSGYDIGCAVTGSERVYLDRLWDDSSAHPSQFNDASRAHYAALYALPGAMVAGFAQFEAFHQDAIDNRAFLKRGKLGMPVLAVGGAHSLGAQMAEIMTHAAVNVQSAVIANSGHWLLDEQPAATVAAIRAFLDAQEP